MDFVVVGLGVGALAILLGLTSREAGSRWWPVRRDQPLAPTERARRLAIGRAGRAGGLVLCLAGVAIVIATILAIGLSLSDQAGAILVMATISATVLGGIAWGTVYVARYHPRPLPRTPGRRAAPDAWPDDAPPSLAGPIDAMVAQPTGRPGSWLDPLGAETVDETVVETVDETVDEGQTGEPPIAGATLGAEPAAESLPDEAGVSPEIEIAAGGDAAEVEVEAESASAAPAAEPAVNGEGRPPNRPAGYVVSSKNQLV